MKMWDNSLHTSSLADLKPIVKDVPADSEPLFRDDVKKRITQLLSVNSALQKD